MADVFVTAETRQLGPELWEAVTYGFEMVDGSPRDRVFRVEAATEGQVQADFITMWNNEHGTEYAAENFDFVPQSE